MSRKKPSPKEVKVVCNCTEKEMKYLSDTVYDPMRKIYHCKKHNVVKSLITNFKKTPDDRLYRKGM